MTKLDKEMLRKRRAEINMEKSATLAPLKKEMTRLERVIIHLEAEQKRTEAALLTASETGDGKKITELSKQLGEFTAQVETNFARLTDITQEHDRKLTEYESKLVEIG